MTTVYMMRNLQLTAKSGVIVTEQGRKASVRFAHRITRDGQFPTGKGVME